MIGSPQFQTDIILVVPDDRQRRHRRRLAWGLGFLAVILGWTVDSELIQALGFLGVVGLMADRRKSTPGAKRTPQQAADHLAITYGVVGNRRAVIGGRIIDV